MVHPTLTYVIYTDWTWYKQTLQMMHCDCNYQLYEGDVLQMAICRGQKEDIKMDQSPVPFPQLCWVYVWNT